MQEILPKYGFSPSGAEILNANFAETVTSRAGLGLYAGTETLVDGAKVVDATWVTANSQVVITAQLGSPFEVYSVTLDPGVGFTIISSNASDSNSVMWIGFA